MSMELQGSCHCGKVTFSVTSTGPVPFMWCYCSICRKCQGGGGYTINILGDMDTLKVEGMEHVKIYRAILDKSLPKEKQELWWLHPNTPSSRSPSGNRRHFCGECGSHLWAWNPAWGHWCYPYASAIDTPLPEPKAEDVMHIMQNYKPNWVLAPPVDGKTVFEEYPNTGLEEWHKKHKEYMH
ncbi:Mss4-like protein [Endogone sp. FLAS-F59071]|nr:Mss4-like protein [Endogone sp. FLAS-F59071]|eukprot:RUS16267.1 Mss4-like protein [Endogone sp. FLAS-F59071]